MVILHELNNCFTCLRLGDNNAIGILHISVVAKESREKGYKEYVENDD